MDNKKIKIKEIFTSIQGEGPYIGEKHLFVRTTKCNLNCSYCDTDFRCDENSKEYNYEEFFEELKSHDANVVSFTGGEPLLEADFLCGFLKRYKNRLNKKIYLETNGTHPEGLEKIIDYVDIIATDIKLKSSTGQDFSLITFDDFMLVAQKKEVFAKIIFDENILDEEIEQSVSFAKKYGILLVLQPKMPISKDFYPYEIFEKFYKKYKNTRLIAQMHKFLDIR